MRQRRVRCRLKKADAAAARRWIRHDIGAESLEALLGSKVLLTGFCLVLGNDKNGMCCTDSILLVEYLLALDVWRHTPDIAIQDGRIRTGRDKSPLVLRRTQSREHVASVVRVRVP